MDGELASRLRDAGLNEDQTRIAVRVFEDFLRERAAGEPPSSGQEFRGLFAGSESFYEHHDD